MTSLQVRRRGTVSEPCTPRREKRKEELGEGLVARLHRLQSSSGGRSRKLDICAQWDLETQSQALHARVEKLQQRSQFRSSDSSTPDDSDNCAQQSDRTGTCSSTMPMVFRPTAYCMLRAREHGQTDRES